jgi:two-component system, chemotaxis family, chemotaxis protein CheV
MSAPGIMDTVDQRTQLVGQNRMEMLMFRFESINQIFGINVFKVREVTQCPKLTVVPSSHPVIRGIADFRGHTIPVIDFSLAIGGARNNNLETSLAIISEYNRSIQALVVSSVERIVNLTWDAIRPPPAGTKGISGSYLTAVTEVDNRLVEIIDVEKILEEVQPGLRDVSADLKSEIEVEEGAEEYTVLIADDSSVARSQLKRCMSSINVNCLAVTDGEQALNFLKEMVRDGRDVHKELLMVISDVEMPAMDGYTLVTEIRRDENLKGLRVVLHTSLSGVFNEALVKKVGADNFIAKFQPDIVATEVKAAIEIKKNKSS